MCGCCHMAAPRTNLTFWPPDKPLILLCVPNSASRPKSIKCFSTLAVVSGRAYKPARAASLSSTRWINLVKPHFSSFSFSIHVVWSMDKFSHLTSYSYLFFFWRREMIFSTTNFMTVPSSLVTLIFSFINFSSSGVYCMVTLVKFSLSSPV